MLPIIVMFRMVAQTDSYQLDGHFERRHKPLAAKNRKGKGKKKLKRDREEGS